MAQGIQTFYILSLIPFQKHIHLSSAIKLGKRPFNFYMKRFNRLGYSVSPYPVLEDLGDVDIALGPHLEESVVLSPRSSSSSRYHEVNKKEVSRVPRIFEPPAFKNDCKKR